MTEIVVIEHVLDSDAGVYRLAVGEPTYEPSNEIIQDDADATQPEMVFVGYVNVCDFLFDASDPRWFNGDDRRPDSDVASDQRSIVKEQLGAAQDNQAPPDEPDASNTLELPGVGEAL